MQKAPSMAFILFNEINFLRSTLTPTQWLFAKGQH
jgi:hypothetical protein